MSRQTRQFTPTDRLLMGLDTALRVSRAPISEASRPNPAADLQDREFEENDRRHAAGLMRINHTGEVCAQALYSGQAATARTDAVRQAMGQAAQEEMDHLAWCQQRLEELGDRPSLFNPLFYAGSWSMGALAGLLGDDWNLGFLQETERQVEAHLAEHQQHLPEGDERSQAIIAQMKTDEAEHAAMAGEAGARELPGPLKELMRLTANCMKAIAYRV